MKILFAEGPENYFHYNYQRGNKDIKTNYKYTI